jgi:hypothetical protein
MGSVWRALAYGFAGLRPAGDPVALDPLLPTGWETLELRGAVPRQSCARPRSTRRPRGERGPASTCTYPGRGARAARRTAQTFELPPPVPHDVSMTALLVALDSDASVQPVLSTAIALATLFEASVAALHVRENGASAPE